MKSKLKRVLQSIAMAVVFAASVSLMNAAEMAVAVPGQVKVAEPVVAQVKPVSVKSLENAFLKELGFPDWYRTCVVVEITIQHEIERSSVTEIGLVIDDEGHILLRSDIFPYWIPSNRIHEIKVHPLAHETNGSGYNATFINKDTHLGWNYIQVESACRPFLKSVTAFPIAQPKVGNMLYSVYHLDKDFNYQPFLCSSPLGTIASTPFHVGILLHNRFGLGAPVFTAKSQFVGWTINASSEAFTLNVGPNHFPITLISRNLGNQIILASDLMSQLNMHPEAINYSERPWLGLVGIIPLDRETLQLLGLNSGAISISKIIEGSPAEKAGLKERDIIIAAEGHELMKHGAKTIVQNDFHRYLWGFKPGDVFHLTILRGNEKMEIPVELGAEPSNEREAKYKYFPELGFTIREFLISDNVEMQQLNLNLRGVRVTFVKPNGPGGSSGLTAGDWIQEVDGATIDTFDQAVEILNNVTAHMAERKVMVLLVSRQSQTKVLQVKLD